MASAFDVIIRNGRYFDGTADRVWAVSRSRMTYLSGASVCHASLDSQVPCWHRLAPLAPLPGGKPCQTAKALEKAANSKWIGQRNRAR